MSTKLTYFNIKGLAEPIRLLLKYGDIEFEDVRIEKDKWPEMKPSKFPIETVSFVTRENFVAV